MFEVFPAGVAWDDDDVARVVRDGQVRIFWDRTPLDLFFNTAPFHENTARNARTVPFADGTIPVLHPNGAGGRPSQHRAGRGAHVPRRLRAGTTRLFSLRP